MVMDLFYASVEGLPRRRVHFHAFMADVHERIFAFRQKVKAGDLRDTDPIPVVADALAAEARLLCFDEFAVNDIADAMILGRLFKGLFEAGVVIVATSNLEPRDLYRDGLNRHRFLPFIAMLEQRLDIARLDAATDYRLEKLAGTKVYHVPADAAATRALEAMFQKLTGGAAAAPARLAIKGREVVVPLQAMGVAMFGFSDLCGKPLGSIDYLAIAQAYHSLVLVGVPKLDFEQRNEAKRFITLVDILYEHRVKLVLSAAAEAEDLYRAANGAEAFEFARTVSRLVEMQSSDYLALPHGRPEKSGAEPAPGIVET
jgi:cell division protein ZapE